MLNRLLNINVRCKNCLWLYAWNSYVTNQTNWWLCRVLILVFSHLRVCGLQPILLYRIPSFVPWSLKGGNTLEIMHFITFLLRQIKSFPEGLKETNTFITFCFVLQGHDLKTISSIRIYWLAFTWGSSSFSTMCTSLIHTRLLDLIQLMNTSAKLDEIFTVLKTSSWKTLFATNHFFHSFTYLRVTWCITLHPWWGYKSSQF